MKTTLTFLFILVCSLTITIPLLAQNPDAEGCQDSPYFSRMPGFYINECQNNDFNGHDFNVGNDSMLTVEGKYWFAYYYLNNGSKSPSDLQILRNYRAVIEKAGGKMLSDGANDEAGRFTQGGSEIWVEVHTSDNGASYSITVVEKGLMKQDVTSGIMLDSLNATGHIALAINFNTGKATIKDESKPIIEQMYDLLKVNADLKVEIQGHTDNVGDAKANQKLSEERANAVMKALVDKGIDAKRMTAAGFGDTKPVADNKTDEGKAKNRRVELVKK